jgi:hypothetical protein
MKYNSVVVMYAMISTYYDIKYTNDNNNNILIMMTDDDVMMTNTSLSQMVLTNIR